MKPPAVHDTPPGEPPDGREGAGIGQVIGPHRRGEQRQGTAESRSTYSWPVSASSAGPLRVVEVMAALDVLEAVAASSREGRTVRLDGGGG